MAGLFVALALTVGASEATKAATLIVVNRTSTRAYVAHANADVIVVFGVATGSVLSTLRTGREPDGVALSPVHVKRR